MRMNLMNARHLAYYDLDLMPHATQLSRQPHHTPVLGSHNVNFPSSIPLAERSDKNSEIDRLTGLPNQSGFKKQLHTLIASIHQKKNHNFGLILFDFDYFNQINTSHGHIVGDHILQTIASRIKKVLPQEVLLSRLGSDEFAILIPNVSSDISLMKIGSLVQQQVSLPLYYRDHIIESNISAGGAIYPRDINQDVNIVEAADIALCYLKQSGRGGCSIFRSEMLVEQNMIAQQFNRARHILRHNLVRPFYQPKFYLESGKLAGFEALLRWYDEDNQIQLPKLIINAFEDYSLASRLSEKMQLNIFKDMASWINQGLQLVPVSINAAPVEFLKDNYAELLLERLNQFEIPYHLIEIEITEHLLDEQGKNFISRALAKLKQNGIRIALDDFGTGHSSLTRLANLPVDCLKIDCDFVQRMEQEKFISALVQSVILMSNNLGIDVVAEGIESQEQLELLKQQGCEVGQGFLFSQALAPENARALLS